MMTSNSCAKAEEAIVEDTKKISARLMISVGEAVRFPMSRKRDANRAPYRNVLFVGRLCQTPSISIAVSQRRPTIIRQLQPLFSRPVFRARSPRLDRRSQPE